jgi:hypothetical protein
MLYGAVFDVNVVENSLYDINEDGNDSYIYICDI